MAFAAPSPARVRLARSLALLADFVQVIAFPLFAGGALSPVSDAMDIGMAIVMTALLGWHWAFVPTMLTELVPVIDLFPTWTFAVFYVTRGQARDPEARGAQGSPAYHPDEPPRRIKDITPEPGREAGTPAAESAPPAAPASPDPMPRQ